jgi:hypothetical protein
MGEVGVRVTAGRIAQVGERPDAASTALAPLRHPTPDRSIEQTTRCGDDQLRRIADLGGYALSEDFARRVVAGVDRGDLDVVAVSLNDEPKNTFELATSDTFLAERWRLWPAQPNHGRRCHSAT